jgi:signal transduction histidine kinase
VIAEPVTKKPPSTSDHKCAATKETWYRPLAAKLFGDPSRVDREHRVLRGVMLLVFVTGLFSILESVLIGVSMYMVGSAILSTLAGLVGYWLACRTHHWRVLLVTIFSFFLFVLSTAWITQAGSNGATGYYFFPLFFFAVAFFKDVGRIASLVSTAVTVVVLLLIEHFVPSAIIPYETPLLRFSDVAFSLPLCLVMVATFFYIVYGEYQRERKAKDNLLHIMTAEKDRVEKSMRQKQRLLTVVSHDIANALTVLQGEILLVRFYRQPYPSINSATLDRMDYACSNIGGIIGSVRMMEAVEQGLIAFSPKPVDLQAVFKNCEVLFAERLDKRRIHIEFPELSEETRFVMADRKILANHVFNNLISNAIKFSYPDSEIVVTVTRKSDSTIIQVTDRGIGMPPELVAHLFELDAKTTRPGTDGEPGTGFGMRTVKSFIDLFGGEIEISSRAENLYPDDHGTTVSIRLKSG